MADDQTKHEIPLPDLVAADSSESPIEIKIEKTKVTKAKILDSFLPSQISSKPKTLKLPRQNAYAGSVGPKLSILTLHT